jgi:metallo-beta-lactamase family protein
MPRITFLGAAGTVTGSKYLLEAGGKRLLLDCGLFEGSKQLRQRNWQRLSVDPTTIDWVVITHAHIDHTGYLPLLVRNGYRGAIFANAATQELCQLLLLDSAHLQEEDAKYAAKKGYTSHKPPLPLYTVEDARKALGQFREIPRSGPFTLSPEFSFVAHDAGHILGSTWLECAIAENGRQTLVDFSGDLGRYSNPILKDPESPSRADFLLCESTYGAHDHPPGDPAGRLTDAVNRTVQRGGVVVIPAFAVDRSQDLLFFFRQLLDQQRIPRLPIYLDSPMAIDATSLYVEHREDHRLEFAQVEQTGRRDPLDTHDVRMTRSVNESKKINGVNSPCIIISASGMATGGRILHHLGQRLPDARNSVLLVGYQGEGTLGRALQEGTREVRIHGVSVAVRAEIFDIGQLSAHAGKSELLRWLSGFCSAPRHTFLVHGEPSALDGLRDAITAQFRWPVTIPNYLQTIELC